jgi:hypothetical protein
MGTLAWTDKAGKAYWLVFDIALSETWTCPCDVTSTPVESGEDVVDEIQLKPKGVQFEGVISDTPRPMHRGGVPGEDLGEYTDLDLGPQQTTKRTEVGKKLDVPDSPLKPNLVSLVSAGIDSIVGGGPPEARLSEFVLATAGPAKARTYQIAGYTSRALLAWTILQELRDTKTLVRYVSDRGDLSGLAFEGLDYVRGPEDGGDLVVNCTLRTIRIIDSTTVEAPKPSVPSGQKRKSAGAKSTEEDPDAETKAKTIAAEAYDAAASTAKDWWGL